jgi:hypothetical protein
MIRNAQYEKILQFISKNTEIIKEIPRNYYGLSSKKGNYYSVKEPTIVQISKRIKVNLQIFERIKRGV